MTVLASIGLPLISHPPILVESSLVEQLALVSRSSHPARLSLILVILPRCLSSSISIEVYYFAELLVLLLHGLAMAAR